MQRSTACFTVANQLGSITPLVAWQSQAQGSRTALKPEALTRSMNCCVGCTPPQAVTLHWDSKVLPKFQPMCIFAAIVCAVGNCAKVDMENSSPSAPQQRRSQVLRTCVFFIWID